MNIDIAKLGKTHITRTMPWGLNLRNGHRLLCADGAIRAASLAQTADTYFSVPAAIRIKGKTLTGYCCVEETEKGRAYAFRPHNNQGAAAWPRQFTPEHEALVNSAL